MEEAIFRTIQAAQEKAAIAMIRDAKDGVSFPHCHPHGRSGGTNPINYGWLQAFLPVYDRASGDTKGEIGAFISRHVRDTVECFWQTMANDGQPPGEYTSIANGVCTGLDYDILRHVDVAGYCDVALHPNFQDLRSLVTPMAIRWGEWLGTVGWEKRTRETLRMGPALNSYVAIFELTKDFKWLMNAVGLLCFGWGDQVRRETVAEDGIVWTTWDSGYPWEKRGGDMAHITDWPWYEGQFAQACLRLWPHAESYIRSLISDRIMKISEKYVNRTMVPEMKPYGKITMSTLGFVSDTRPPGPWPINTPLHGGMPNSSLEGDSWLYKDREVLTPEEWISLGEDEVYRQLRCLYWRSIDGDYESPDFVDEAGDIIAHRDHHPRTPPYDPQLKRDHYGIPDLLYARYLLTQEESDRLLAIWLMHDYVGFCNQSGHIAFPKKKFSSNWYGDAAGKSRLLAWRFMSGWHMMRAEMKK